MPNLDFKEILPLCYWVMRPEFRALKNRLEDNLCFIRCKLTLFCVTSRNIAKNIDTNAYSKQIELL